MIRISICPRSEPQMFIFSINVCLTGIALAKLLPSVCVCVYVQWKFASFHTFSLISLTFSAVLVVLRFARVSMLFDPSATLVQAEIFAQTFMPPSGGISDSPTIRSKFQTLPSATITTFLPLHWQLNRSMSWHSAKTAEHKDLYI